MWAGGFKDRAEIVFLIGQYDQNQRKQMLELGITEKTFQLGCAPIVNLFRANRRADSAGSAEVRILDRARCAPAECDRNLLGR